MPKALGFGSDRVGFDFFLCVCRYVSVQPINNVIFANMVDRTANT